MMILSGQVKDTEDEGAERGWKWWIMEQGWLEKKVKIIGIR